MKKLFKPASITFYFLMLLVFFLVGIHAAGFVGAGKDQMLAGGAIVVGWGLLFGIGAFIAAFFICYHLVHKNIVRLNWILLVSLTMLYGITHYRYLEREREKNKEETEQFENKITKPVE